MLDPKDELYKDFETIRQISLIPTMLDVVCRLTGLGFAAVARVTDNRWLACSVRDEVNFGLAEGDELKIETTICNEIREHHEPVVIDHVAKDERYKDHHTPKMYGLQSYISFPIILKNGEFFGTLCAIGSEPACLNDPKITGTFMMFTELLSFHLQSLDVMDRSRFALKETNRRLSNAYDENELYKKISDHNLQEQLRKISVFSDMILTDTAGSDLTKIKETALKINASARTLNNMMQHLSRFSALSAEGNALQQVDLYKTALHAKAQLAKETGGKNTRVEIDTLPIIYGVPEQMDELFFQLMDHVPGFLKKDDVKGIHVYSEQLTPGNTTYPLPVGDQFKYCKIFIEQTGIMPEEHNTQNIFDIFVHLSTDEPTGKYGVGLAHCRKIVHNHGGMITAQSIKEGISFCMILPLNYKVPALNEEAVYKGSPD